ncbi:MAG: PKD domain-containing protein [bacterium]|nr:PKD domain-containing protein [bacterium]
MLKKTILLSMLLCMIFAFHTPAFSWESNVTIASGNGKQFEKPEIGYAPDYTVYIVYRQKQSSVSDIYMSHYDGVSITSENVSESATLFNKHKCYEPDIEITPDETIHVAWVTHDKTHTDTHYVKYRRKVGDTWSQVYSLGTLHMHTDDFVFDFRLGVSTNVAADNEEGLDPSYNVHVVFAYDEDKIVKAISMYDTTVVDHGRIGDQDGAATFEKHPDIAVDQNFVHYVWMRKKGFPYVEMHQQAVNTLNGAWSEQTQLTFPTEPWASQKCRIDLDSDGYFHLADFHKTGDNKKLKYYVQQPDGSLPENYVNLSNPSVLELYHFAALEVRDNTKTLDENGLPGKLTVFASMQRGQTKETIGGKSIHFSWKRNGVWSLYNTLPDTKQCLHQSADLSPDGEQASVVWQKLTKSIVLTSSGPIVEIPVIPPPPPPPPTVPVVAKFTFSTPVFSGSAVTFDASETIELNPSANITGYRWDFGDATIENTQSPTITHTFNNYGITYTVTLTVFSDSEETEDSGSTQAAIFSNALYSIGTATFTTRSQRSLFFSKAINTVQWTANAKNAEAGYSIVTYKLLRAEGSGDNDTDYVQVAELPAGTTTYEDSTGLSSTKTYSYYIICVDAAGHESIFGRI